MRRIVVCAVATAMTVTAVALAATYRTGLYSADFPSTHAAGINLTIHMAGKISASGKRSGLAHVQRNAPEDHGGGSARWRSRTDWSAAPGRGWFGTYEPESGFVSPPDLPSL
jgi:hypothetical protein